VSSKGCGLASLDESSLRVGSVDRFAIVLSESALS